MLRGRQLTVRRVQGEGAFADGTAAAEQELMVLWSALERDRADDAAATASTQDTDLQLHEAADGIAGQQHDRQEALNLFADAPLITAGEGTAVPLQPHSPGTLEVTKPFTPQEHVALHQGDTTPSDDPLERHYPVQPAEAPNLLQSGSAPLAGAQTLERDAARVPARVQPPQQRQYDLQQSFARVLLSTVTGTLGLLHGPEQRAVALAIALAFFNQVGASTSIINYAPEVLQQAGLRENQRAILVSSLIGVAKMVGVLIGVRRGWCSGACRCMHRADCPFLFSFSAARTQQVLDTRGSLSGSQIWHPYCRHGSGGPMGPAAAPAGWKCRVRARHVWPLRGAAC
jgi:Sugar (and other) transporter